MKKILVLANSFGEDCTAYAQSLAPDLFVRNLYVPACSLEQHSRFIEEGAEVYQYQENAVMIGEKTISANEAFALEPWDHIVLQQASFLAGKYSSFYPYLTEIISYIKSVCPQAKLVFHQTWAYEKNSPHEMFSLYGRDASVMFRRIKSACGRVAAENGLPLLRTGEFLQRLRRYKLFRDGSLCRDTYHLSTEYGRYAAALLFVRFFGEEYDKNFLPENAREEKIGKIREVLAQFEKDGCIL